MSGRRRRSSRSLRRRLHRRFSLTQIRHFVFVVLVAVAALGAGYFVSRCDPTPASQGE
jgi:hypothetical protein